MQKQIVFMAFNGVIKKGHPGTFDPVDLSKDYTTGVQDAKIKSKKILPRF